MFKEKAGFHKIRESRYSEIVFKWKFKVETIFPQQNEKHLGQDSNLGPLAIRANALSPELPRDIRYIYSV